MKIEIKIIGYGGIWSCKVTATQTKGEETYYIQINYKGYSIQEVKGFNYNVETENNGVIDFGEKNVFLNEEGVYQSKLLVFNSPSTSVKDRLVMTMDWEGKSESFSLLNK